MHVSYVCTHGKCYISGILLKVSECMQTCELSPLGSSCGCCLVKNAAVFMLVICCVKSLVTTPESAWGGGAYLLFASYQGWKSGVVKMQKQEIMTPLYKFNEYILLWSQSGIRHILTGPTMSRWSPGRCVGACVFCVRQKFFFLFVWMFFWLAFTCFSNAWNRVIFVNRIIMPGDGRLQINGGTISLTAIIST